MARWEPDAGGRLARAALDLYIEHGFERTTVAEIAERAGLTERTFFRYFADKREVLFDGSSLLERTVVESIGAAPDDAGPLDAVGPAVVRAGAVLDERREHARRRATVVAANQSLQERELLKMAALTEAAAEALRGRGVDDLPARLAAATGVAAFSAAFARWVAQDAAAPTPMAEHVREALAALDGLTAASARRAAVV
ncbi:TetR family transcriptional regulator [Cellulomonas sp. PhB143]|uniref:TetR family transcriptional regulator n=1 Tax=Cellulomonas sp. PhB143 TaxID=2485186 RepID=UPI000F492256|nr:TetR family transcriptional regulator [Cellulomonas sp. PhB143]ROS75436.1 TetR family transcriptional regulator [Cellulomonas sp. PhB143]